MFHCAESGVSAIIKRMNYSDGMRPRFARAIIIILAISVSGVMGYGIGTAHPKTVVIRGVANTASDAVNAGDFAIFWDAWKGIEGSYLRAGQLKNRDLTYGATSGLVAALKDPYSVFMTPDDSKRFSEDLNGNFGGIGAEIGIKNDQLIVIAPLKDSPAEKAGLISGDKLLEINASSTAGLAINDAVKMIRGPKGTAVNFTVGRNGKEKPLTIRVTRDTIAIPVLEWKMKEGNVAHIQLFTFSENSAALMRNALYEAKAAGAKGIVLDMRNNPGGYLDAAIAIAGYFMNPGQTVIFEEFRNGRKDSFETEGTPIVAGLPIAILMNAGSASASEILAGALKDDVKAPIVGEKSFGKGTVQELTTLRDGSELKLTIAHWILPKGTQIDKNGIVPDVAVKISDEDREKKRDPQLEKALELVRAKL